jgi:hypothetical protein
VNGYEFSQVAAIQKQAMRDLTPVWDILAIEQLADVPMGCWPMV